MRLSLRTILALLVGLAPATASAQVTLHGVGDLPGGPNISVIRDATKQGGFIYAVGASAANTQVLCTGPNTPVGCVPQFNADTAVLWTWNGTSGTLTPLPNLVAGNTASSGLFSASAITPDAAFIASQARSASGVGFLAVRVATNGLVNLNLNAAPFPTLNPHTAALAISNDGLVLYGVQNTDGTTHAVRFDVNGTTSSIIPLFAGMTNNQPAFKGTSSNGSVMVGTAFTQPYSGTTNGRAFRYTHGTGVVSGIPMLPGGTWNKVLAVSADGDLTLVAGNSPEVPNGEMYLRRLSTLTTTPLGSPNQAMNPASQGSMTADGSVVMVTFANPSNGQNGSGDRITYFHNSHGWFQLMGALRKGGVEPLAAGWSHLIATGMSSDGTLVFGQGDRPDDEEGFVAEFPAGFLANYDAPATPPSYPAAVGVWRVSEGGNPDDAGYMVLMANGTFYLIGGNAGDTGPVNPGGFERGTYTWDAQGHFALTFRQDLNGSAGFSEIDGLVLTATVVGDTLTLFFPAEFCEPGEDCSGGFPLTRVASGAASIVGGFLGGNAATDDDSFVVVLLESGIFFFAGDQPDVDGIEKGTYTWDPVTHDFHVTSKVLDTNGPDEGVTDSNVVLSPNGLSATVTGPEGTVVVARIGAVAPPRVRLNGLEPPTGISVNGGAAITADLLNGPGNPGDWVGLYATGAADGTYIDWKYLNGLRTQPGVGMTGGTVVFTMPTTPGTYNVRFFLNNSTTKLATSGTITVMAPVAPSVDLSATTAGPRATVTATIANGPGNAGDWVGLYATGAPDGTYVDWKYLNGTRTQPGAGMTGAAVAFTMPAALGTYNVRFFLNNSTTKLATSATITVTMPSVALSATTAVPGGTVTATTANGPGNVGDWVGLYATGAADGTYIDWKYLNGTRTQPGAGLTGASVAFMMPATPGTYNVRLFLNNSTTKLATSATITVASTTTVTTNLTTVTAGQPLTATIANGPGTAGDWVGLYATGAPDGTYIDWKYLNGTRTQPGAGVTGAAVTFTMPATPGTYNVRFFLNNSTTKLATSATITVTAAPAPSIVLSATTVAPRAVVTATIANGPGNAGDWVGLYAAGAPNGTYVDWKYLNGTRTQPGAGLTGAAVTFTMPATPGTYNVRFFLNNSTGLLATSLTITVQ